jgi:Asp-tRNA(Asn)/Glu-tRNA(Gln) amidotransferase A subunit family amidase
MSVLADYDACDGLGQALRASNYSVPLYWNEAGLPIGMHFVGRFGDEATLVRLAGQLERAQPWVDRVSDLAGVRE